MGLGNWGGFDIIDRWALAIKEMAKRATAAEFRTSSGHKGADDLLWEMRFGGHKRNCEQIRAARRKNGVGRPPKIFLEREKARLIRSASKPFVEKRRRLIAIPPGPRLNKKAAGLAALICDWDAGLSTAALRKSKQRKGRA